MAFVERPIIHVGSVDGKGVHKQRVTQYIPSGPFQITDTVALRQSRNLAVVRDGGLGDILLVTPTLRLLHETFPHVDIHLFTRAPYLPLFEDNPHVTEVRSLDQYQRWAFDTVVDLQHFVERSPDANIVDRASLFTAAFGLDLKNGDLEYSVREEETEWAKGWLRDNGVGEKWMMLAPFATDPRRSWPIDNAQKFIRLVSEDGWRVVVSHHLDDAEKCFGDIATPCITPTIRQKAALLKESGFVVSVDTGIYHLAMAARGKEKTPRVAVLFGPIDPGLRMKWYKNYIVISAKELDCVPCCENHALVRTCDGACMSVLSGERVYRALKRMKGI